MNTKILPVDDSGARLIPSRAAPRPRKRVLAKAPGVIAQVRIALSPRHRLATVVGFLFGGAMPALSYAVTHYELDAALWAVSPVKATALGALVLGCLVFSATTVCEWCRAAFRSPSKAVGFVVAAEVAMVVSSLPAVGWASLFYLVGVNAVATGVNFSRS